MFKGRNSMSKQAKATHQSPELEKNKQLVRNFIENTLNRHDTAAADKYFGQNLLSIALIA
jgi:hypothetical protein